MRRLAVSLGVLLASVLPACGDGERRFEHMEPGETGRVVRIVDGDSFVLDGGQKVRLVGLEAPRLDWGGDDHEPFAEDSARMLESLILGRKVQLHYPGPTRDRLDRALAHVVTADGAGAPVWVNLAMVDRGGAWVWFYPDTDAEADMLVAGEAHARESGQGLWSLSAYQPRDASTANVSPTQRFRILRGALGPAVTSETPGEDVQDIRHVCRRRLGDDETWVYVTSLAVAACAYPEGALAEVRTALPGDVVLTHPRHLVLLDDGDAAD